MEVGRTVVYAILTQVNLVTTLSVAVIGGVVVLLIQIVFHNKDKNKIKVSLNWIKLVPLILLLEGVSVLFSYFATGAVTSEIPILLQTKYSPTYLANQNITSLDLIGYLVLVQFSTFFAGIVCIILLLFRNRNLLHTR